MKIISQHFRDVGNCTFIADISRPGNANDRHPIPRAAEGLAVRVNGVVMRSSLHLLGASRLPLE